jgi:hypothetical protein
MSEAIIIVAKTGRAIDTSDSFTIVHPFFSCFRQLSMNNHNTTAVFEIIQSDRRDSVAIPQAL